MKTYVVTGVSRGIGLELARQILEKGNRLHALARKPEAATGLMQLRERYPEQMKAHTVDVTAQDTIRKFLSELGQEPVDVLINNAGVYGEEEDNFEKLSLEEVEKTFRTNTIGPMMMTQALLPNLKRSASPKVLHVTSMMGSIGDNGSGGSYGYRISKAALNMFEKSFSIDYPQIVSAVIHPGWVQTDMGGPGATITPAESARGMLRVLDGLTREKSGNFLDYEGDSLPW